MEKIIFRKLILDISLRALIITFTIGLIVWIIQAVNHLDFVINDGHNFKIYFYYNLYNFPKIIHRIIPFVFAISIFFELIKYEKNNELLIFWTNGITKKKFVRNLVNFAIIAMFLQIVMGSFISPNSQLKARTFLKNSNMDFLPNLIKQGKFIDIVSGLTIFISEKTGVNSFNNIYIQEGDSFSLEKNDNQIIFAKEGLLVDENKELIKSFGVWGKKKFMGREYDGIHRMTFIINEKGMIENIYKKINVNSHGQKILDDLLTNKD